MITPIFESWARRAGASVVWFHPDEVGLCEPHLQVVESIEPLEIQHHKFLRFRSCGRPRRRLRQETLAVSAERS